MHSTDRQLAAEHTVSAPEPRVLHVGRGGTSVVIDLDAAPAPAIVHWGAALADSTPETLRSLAIAARAQRVSGGLDATPALTLLPTGAEGWFGTPGLEGHREGSGLSTRLTLADVQAGEHRASIALADAEAGLAVRVEVRIGLSGLCLLYTSPSPRDS